jgi:hypothetical protein
MKFGLQVNLNRDWWLGKSKDWSIAILLPAISFGYHTPNDSIYNDIDSKWFGFKLKLTSDISFESYEYGKIFTFCILGCGFRISRYNIKIK